MEGVDNGTGPQPTGSTRRRGDIDGLRAVAIIAVVAYHAHVPGFRGGFVGVDVFFVISGYLITGKILNEVQRTDSVSLRDFWAGRIRRLVPALALVVGVVLVAAVVVLGPSEWVRATTDAAASLTYVSNLRFAATSTHYFSASADSSLFLHTWSLGVEEQFYLLWPLLLLGLARLAGTGADRRRRFTAWTLGVATATSLAVYVAFTARGTPWAFFSLPTRAWEFGLGGLTTLAAATTRRVRPSADAVLGLVGLGVIVGATCLLSDITPYPGWAGVIPSSVAMVIPVLGTVAVILAGEHGARSLVGRILGSRAAQVLGRQSYSWYLWHWPVILLGVAVAEHDTAFVRSCGALLALGLAAVSLRFVEDPLRFSPRLVANPARTLAVGAAVTLLVGAVALGVRVAGDHELALPFYRRIAAARSTQGDFDAFGECIGPVHDIPGVPYCVDGDRHARKTIVVVGDSHATQWRPALAIAAERLNYRVLLRSEGGCPSIPVEIADSAVRLLPSKVCAQFRTGTDRLIRQVHPSAVILMNSEGYLGRILDPHDDHRLPSTAGQVALYQDAFEHRVEQFQRMGIPVGVVLDNPDLLSDPNVCMERHGHVGGCAPSRADALQTTAPFHRALDQVLARVGTIPTLDVSELICPDRCSIQMDGHLVFRDSNHLTHAFVVNEADPITHLLQQVATASDR